MLVYVNGHLCLWATNNVCCVMSEAPSPFEGALRDVETYAAVMNRIAELRQLKGWTQKQLAERVGVHEMTILRLEKGSTQLMVAWMQKLAKAFNCSAADLLDIATLAETEDDVAAADLGSLGALANAIARKGLSTYKVVGSSVSSAGIPEGETIAVDTSKDAIDGIRTGDVVLVELTTRQRSVLVLRQFLSPGLLVTNRDGNNLAISLNDLTLRPRVVGLVIRN